MQTVQTLIRRRVRRRLIRIYTVNRLYMPLSWDAWHKWVKRLRVGPLLVQLISHFRLFYGLIIDHLKLIICFQTHVLVITFSSFVAQSSNSNKELKRLFLVHCTRLKTSPPFLIRWRH